MAGPESFDEYLSQVPDEARAALEGLRKTIKSAAPDTTETISYQMPTFKYQGRALVGDRGIQGPLQPVSLQQEGHGGTRGGFAVL